MIKLPASRETSRDAKIQFLVGRKFPPLLLAGCSPRELAASREQSDQYRKTLGSMPDVEIERQYASARAEAMRAKMEIDEAARPFNKPFARADVNRWAKMSYWTPDEAVALSLGREPKIATWDAVQHLVQVSAFATKFASKREIVMRARTMGQIWGRTIPSLFLAWAERIQFPMPDDLIEAVKALGHQVADWKALFEQQKIKTEAANKTILELRESNIQETRANTEYISKMAKRQDAIASKYDELLEQSQSKVESLIQQIQELNM